MRNFGIWLADSPFGGMLPVAINYVNGMDLRYGSVSE